MAERLPTSVLFQRGPRSPRRIALTFDDGPSPFTRRYLDVLNHAGAKASFFVIGRNCQGHAPELEETVRRGHHLASHGFTHTPFPELGARALKDELARTEALLPGEPGRLRMVRPPFGKMTPASLLRSYRAGYASAMWSFDPLDWDAASSSDVVRAVDPAKLRSGDIVLLHEARPITLDALPQILERLCAAGFELVTVTNLLQV